MQVLELKETNHSGFGLKIPLKEKSLSIDIYFAVENIPLNQSIKRQQRNFLKMHELNENITGSTLIL